MTDINQLEIKQLERAADVLRAVAHPIRLQIIQLLSQKEMTVTEIYQTLGTRQSSTSQQLNIMKTRDIVKSRRKGNQVYYSLRHPQIIQLIGCISNCTSAHDPEGE